MGGVYSALELEDAKGAQWVREHRAELARADFFELCMAEAVRLMEAGQSVSEASFEASQTVGRDIHPQIRRDIVVADPRHHSLTMKRFLRLIGGWARFELRFDLTESEEEEEE